MAQRVSFWTEEEKHVDPADSARPWEHILTAMEGGWDEDHVLQMVVRKIHSSNSRELEDRKGYRLRPSSKWAKQQVLSMACGKGFENVLKVMLLEPSMDACFNDSEGFRLACRKGRESIVKLLMTQTKVDVSARHSEGLVKACKNGHLGIVRLLLADTRSRPSDDRNAAVRVAARWGREKVLTEILASGRVDLSEGGREAASLAARYGHAECIKTLLRHSNSAALVDIGVLLDAVEEGRTGAVRVLLEQGVVDPSEHENESLAIAIEQQDRAMVRELLRDPRCRSFSFAKATSMVQEEFIALVNNAVSAARRCKVWHKLLVSEHGLPDAVVREILAWAFGDDLIISYGPPGKVSRAIQLLRTISI